MQPANSLWLVKVIENNEVHRDFIVRATTRIQAIEYLKAEMINTEFNEHLMLSVELLEPNGEPGIVMIGEW